MPTDSRRATRAPRGRTRATHSREQIVDAAIAMLEREGASGLTLGGLGSVYWHVAGKGELLELACDRLIGRALSNAGLEPYSDVRAADQAPEQHVRRSTRGEGAAREGVPSSARPTRRCSRPRPPCAGPRSRCGTRSTGTRGSPRKPPSAAPTCPTACS